MPRFGNEKKHFLQFMSHLKISLKKCDGWSLMNGVILLRLMLRDRSLKAKKGKSMIEPVRCRLFLDKEIAL